jgi:hypothetical protein
MAPKTRFSDSPLVSPHDSHDLGCQESYVVPTLDTLALVLDQMALVNARMDAQSANAVAHVAGVAVDPLSLSAVAMRILNPLATSCR